MDKRAYTYVIDPIGSGEGEENSVHQVSPAWVLTFVRWANRDTLRNKSSSTEVREPLVVENDCLQVTTTTTKGTLTPSMNATLIMSNVNYLTSLAPGDFVFVNMLNSPEEARRVGDLARAKKPINGIKDGFKGIFKVQGVRRVVTTDPASGTKMAVIRVSGYAFTEFNNTIYFNPYLVDPNQDKKNELLFASFLGNEWQKLVNPKGTINCQDIIKTLIKCFIGHGIRKEEQVDKSGAVRSTTTHFYMPQIVGQLLGIPGAKAAKDIYDLLLGIQKYGGNSVVSPEIGLNPSKLTPVQGDSLVRAEYWNQIKAWAILNQYTNAPLNELFTTFRLNKSGQILPTVVFRQIPFTTEDFVGSSTVTKFMNIPRWKINSALVLEQDIGRDESARINFVQFFGKSAVGVAGSDIAMEIARKNYVYDIGDVQRSGLRPYIVTTQFDDNTDTYKEYRSPVWAKILGNALVGGHLKMNGTITCAGIVDPIAVGDNLELDNVVYHIESIAHTCTINVSNGQTIFRTTISLSSGLDVSSSAVGTRYAEMDHTSAQVRRQQDADNLEILPGVGGYQDTIAAQDFINPAGKDDSSFVQPGSPIRTPNKDNKKAKKV
jgi:hypothetical protein